ncbi:hypothetical protein G6F43_001080 [Rhizopus delemar]|nr:hypothetical protein G6F43_001080 [Rhizopus delemar]
MYQDCLCVDEFNYYRNPPVWQDQTTQHLQLWDNNKLNPFPTHQNRFLFSPSFNPHSLNQNSMMPASTIKPKENACLPDQEPFFSGSAMTFCNSSSTSSLVSSPSVSPNTNSYPFISQNMASLISSEGNIPPQQYHQNNIMVPTNNTTFQYPSYLSSSLGPFSYSKLPTDGGSVKQAKCTKNKIYDCNICPRSFARKHDLQRHIRVHTGAKPYYCLNCEKSFARTDALKRHLRMEESCRMSPVIQALKNVGMRRYRNL